MDRPREYHVRLDKSDRERKILYDSTYMWDPKGKTNEQTLQKRNRIVDTLQRTNRWWAERRRGRNGRIRRKRLSGTNFQLQNKSRG